MRRLAIATVLIAACSKHDAPAPTGGSGSPASSSSAVPGGGGCGHIPLGDFQALVAKPLTEVSGAPIGACNAYIAKGQPGFVFAATMYTDDAPRPFEPTAVNAHPLPGVGDKAYWVLVQEKGPRVESLKGKYHCEIEPPHRDASTLTSMTEAAQAAYAQLEGRLCNDMFAAL